MKQELPSTLSQYLLREADRFFIYPYRRRSRRATPKFLRLRQEFDRAYRPFLDWRKTFVPAKQDVRAFDVWNTAEMLDQMLCRTMLKDIPQVVQRTRALKD